MKKEFILNIVNDGDDPIQKGDMIYECPCCKGYHGINSDCKQGQRA